MRYKLTGQIRRAGDGELLADLVKTAKRMGVKTLSNKVYRVCGGYNPTTVIRRFGSWNNALIMAGLRVGKVVNAGVPDLLQNIGDLWDKLGRQPHLSDLHRPLSRYGRRPYLRTFGSWRVALETFVQASSALPRKGGVKGSAVVNVRPDVIKAKGQINKDAPLTVSWRVRHLVMKRDHFRCRACGSSPATDAAIVLHIDHVVPVSRGGTSGPENLQTLCERCNIGKGDFF